MKVREFCTMIHMTVQLCESVEAEEGKFDYRKINIPCYIDELPEELQNREVRFLYPESCNIMGIFLTDDAEPEEDLHAALQELEEESESPAEEFDDECLPWESLESPEKSVETIDDVLVFRKEDGDKFYEFTTVYYDRETKNLIIVCDGANMDFESELNENLIQLTYIGGEEKLQILVPERELEFVPPECPPGLPFSEDEEVEQ